MKRGVKNLSLEKISDDVLMTEFGDALKSIEELLNTAPR